MSVIEISNDDTHLSVYRGFLVISVDDDSHKVPVDMVESIIVTGRKISYTNSFLVRLCEEGIPLILCGSNFQPIGILNSLSLYHKQTERLFYQIKLKNTVRKQLWQTVIKQKIQKQAEVLELTGKNDNPLFELSKRVKTDDSENTEAYAARIYWKQLLGKSFTRDFKQEGINSFLNYGYAIIRGAFSRSVVGAGLCPALGIHHHNKLNPFCLVDDLMEPFRPLIDMTLYDIIKEKGEDLLLNPEYKRRFVSILDDYVVIEEQKTKIRNAIQRCVWSYVDSLEINKNVLVSYKMAHDR